MTICRELAIVNRRATRIEVRPLKCRCWHCEYCAPDRQKQLRALAFAGSPDTFLTLTVNPAIGDGPDHRARMLVKAWRLIRRRCEKFAKKPHPRPVTLHASGTLPFLAVLEKTKKGEPHIHIIARSKWLSQKWLSNQMNELMKAPIVDIRRIDGESKVGNYITKYLGKDPVAFKGTKRYWRSRDWVDPEEWNNRDEALDEFATYISDHGVDATVRVLQLECWAEYHREGDTVYLARDPFPWEKRSHPPWTTWRRLHGANGL